MAEWFWSLTSQFAAGLSHITGRGVQMSDGQAGIGSKTLMACQTTPISCAQLTLADANSRVNGMEISLSALTARVCGSLYWGLIDMTTELAER
jgi:hypothetical protein